MRHGFGFAIQRLRPALRRQLGRPSVGPVRFPDDELARHLAWRSKELGPTFVKLGQVLSTRPDLLPPPYIEELSLLQDSVPPEPWADVSRVLEKEFGRPLAEEFASIDPQPLARGFTRRRCMRPFFRMARLSWSRSSAPTSSR